MSNEEFYKKYKDFATPLEGEKYKIYDDSTGVPTVGIGFALISRVGETEWRPYSQDNLEKLGINLSNEQYEVIAAYAKAKSKKDSTAALKMQLDSWDYRIDSKTSDSLFKYIVQEKQNFINKGIGKDTWDKLNHAQKIGVMDHCFHHGNVDKIKEPIKSGNFDQAAEIIRQTDKPSLKARHELRADFVKYGKMEFEGVHVVKPGDSFDEIAIAKGLTREELKNLNPGIANTRECSTNCVKILNFDSL